MPDLFSNPNPTEPYQTPSLQQRISAAIDGFRKGVTPQVPTKPLMVKGEPQGAPQDKTTDDPAGRALPDANFIQPYQRQWQELFMLRNGRLQRYQDYEAIDTGYGEAMLDAFVDSCLVSDDGRLKGFTVEAKSKYQNILDQLIDDTNLLFLIRVILRDLLKFGDNWIGYVFSENYDIVDFDNPPPSQMFTFTDPHLRLLTGTEKGMDGKSEFGRAFQQKNGALVTVAGWQPFEMVHLRWKPSKRLVYSERSFLDGFRKDFRKLELIEESLVIHRVTRSSPRLARFMDTTGKTEAEAREMMDSIIAETRTQTMADGSAQEHTMSVAEDYWIGNAYRPPAPDGKLYSGLNDVKFLDPRNTGLAALPDVDYLRKKMFSRIPSEVVGVLSDREDISTQDIAASRLYSHAQDILETQFLRPLFNLALLLKGYVPQKDDYAILFPDVQLRTSWRFADAAFRLSMQESNNLANGTDNRKTIYKNKNGATDAEWEEHLKQWESEAKIFTPPEPTKSGTEKEPKAKKINQIRGGNKSESTDSDPSDESPLETARREYAESVLPLLKELRQDPPHITVNFPEQSAPVVNVSPTSPDIHIAQPAITVNIPPQDAPHITVNVPESKAPDIYFPDQPPPQVTVNLPEQAAPQITVNTPEQPTPQVTVNVPSQEPPIINNQVNLPENVAAQVTVNVPEQAAPQVTVNVPEQQAPVINNQVNLPENVAAQVTVNIPEQPTPSVTVNVPEQPAPYIHNQVNVPDALPPMITVNVPEQVAPIINVAPADVHIDNHLPEQVAPQIVVNVPEQVPAQVVVNLPTDAIKVDVSAEVTLPQEETVEVLRDTMGKTTGFTKKRKYTKRAKKDTTAQTETAEPQQVTEQKESVEMPAAE